VGGIAVIAFVQASSANQGGELLSAWIVSAIFGVAYAVLGAVTQADFEQRRRDYERRRDREGPSDPEGL
jgi:hypothetical protein